MFPPFDESKAYDICLRIIKDLNEGSSLLVATNRVSQERQDQGIMIGACLCIDKFNNYIILKTVSGLAKEIRDTVPRDNEFFVPPIVSSSSIDNALKANDELIHELTYKINALKDSRKREDGKYNDMSIEEKSLRDQRGKLTNESLMNVYKLYNFHCFDGKVRSLLDITKTLPPTGTGDCCAPKLIDYAFSHGYKILSLCEVFYGLSKSKVSGEKYEPCNERCSLILPSMLGLEILYRDESIVVVNKQSGLLSVPGRGPDKQDCIVNRLKALYPSCIEQPAVHRLDMETSGLMVLALNKESHRELNRQFENRETYKEYTAIVDGHIEETCGMMELYFRLDIDNRPHQIWDEVNGKKAITEWKKLSYEVYEDPEGIKHEVTRILYIPHTGRTHQLRLASSDKHGLGCPIIGDTLYGSCKEGERLLLHSHYLSFTHPVTLQRMEFKCPAPF